MKIKGFVLAAALVAGGWFAVSMAAQPTIKHSAAPAVPSVEGAELFSAYCATCHGAGGRGDGRAAAYLERAVPDLTRIAERDGSFDYWATFNAIAGIDRPSDHPMPAWSPILDATYSSRDRERLVINNLVRHIEQMQLSSTVVAESKIAAPKVRMAPIPMLTKYDGATAFAAYCADCHGAEGRGDGRLAPRLGVPIPDLTRLSVERGQFDHQRIQSFIAGRHMVPAGEAESWYDVLSWSYGVGRGQLILSNLTDYLEQMQVEGRLESSATQGEAAFLLRPIPTVARLDGKVLYAAYCVDCHGEQGRGDGRYSGRISARVPSLGQLTDDRGRFDSDAVRAAIVQRHMLPTSAAEPWFDLFENSYGFNRSQVVVGELVRHVETLQAQN